MCPRLAYWTVNMQCIKSQGFCINAQKEARGSLRTTLQLRRNSWLVKNGAYWLTNQGNEKFWSTCAHSVHSRGFALPVSLIEKRKIAHFHFLFENPSSVNIWRVLSQSVTHFEWANNCLNLMIKWNTKGAVRYSVIIFKKTLIFIFIFIFLTDDRYLFCSEIIYLFSEFEYFCNLYLLT